MIDITELTDKEVLIIILLTIPFIVLYLSGVFFSYVSFIKK